MAEEVYTCKAENSITNIFFIFRLLPMRLVTTLEWPTISTKSMQHFSLIDMIQKTRLVTTLGLSWITIRFSLHPMSSRKTVQVIGFLLLHNFVKMSRSKYVSGIWLEISTTRRHSKWPLVPKLTHKLKFVLLALFWPQLTSFRVSNLKSKIDFHPTYLVL